MTSCEQVRDALLEADPASLRGEGEDAVSRHIGSCPDCAAAAARILRSRDDLAAALVSMSAGVAPSADPERARNQVGRRRWSRRMVVWGVAAPLATAAMLVVALFQVGQRVDAGPPLGTFPTWALPVSGAAGQGTIVQETAERVAVLSTDNPDITVVWFIK